ncbi:hypothetical protein LOTGIDRAFT_173994 [Lottia gigantea]|uniref:Uncharacterized protein n=1 Tax=Lottia gigantea TaxID=225164 RepID=V4APE2_LOTGI|nr:hypothetical protein LOTGIDRAFT_173994 [Lottia gigantea]ESO99067.1 hypothetical protein LOTGIDRAFT_173994 [Lottia gigantea]
MASQNNSSSDVFYPDDHELSRHGGVYSPLSQYSTYSHEVKYIFNPIQDDDPNADYSLISPRTKTNNVQIQNSRTMSSSSLYSDHSSVKDVNIGVPHSQSGYSNYSLVSQARRKTRSPSVTMNNNSIHNNSVSTGRDVIRQCNVQYIMDIPPPPPLYEDVERVPPKLAPISGVLPQNIYSWSVIKVRTIPLYCSLLQLNILVIVIAC